MWGRLTCRVALPRLYAHKGCLAATANAALLGKCLGLHMWDSTQLQARQLSCINRSLAERLRVSGIGRLSELQAADARRIEAVARRNFPFGAALCSIRLQGTLNAEEGNIRISGAQAGVLQAIK